VYLCADLNPLLVKRKILLIAFLFQAVVLFAGEPSCNQCTNGVPNQKITDLVDYFVIVKTGTKYSAEFLQSALLKANFCGSFYENKRNEIIFDDGSVIQLKSNTELLSEGRSLNQNCVMADSVEYNSYVWSISAEGYILKGHPHKPEKHLIIND
jgi:hypothetical protein